MVAAQEDDRLAVADEVFREGQSVQGLAFLGGARLERPRAAAMPDRPTEVQRPDRIVGECMPVATGVGITTGAATTFIEADIAVAMATGTAFA